MQVGSTPSMGEIMGINKLLVQYFLENEFSKKTEKKVEKVDDVVQ